MNRISFLFLFFTVWAHCAYAQDVSVIQIAEDHPDEEIKASHLFESVRYLPLETKDDCLVGAGSIEMNLIGDSLLVWDGDNCFLFHAGTGRFIREIGHTGEDPEGMSSPYGNVYNPYDGLIYFRGIHTAMVRYDLVGNFRGRFHVPLSSNWSTSLCLAALDATTFCGFFPNCNGSESKRILLFDTKGEVVKEYPNHHVMKTDQYVMDTNEGLFYRYNDRVYFREKYIDTVYQVGKDELLPVYRLDFSPYVVPYQEKFQVNPNTVACPYWLFETDRFIAFRYHREIFSEIGIYDKREKAATFYSYEKGFLDDLNGFMPFEIDAMPEGRVALGLLQAPDVCEYVGKHKTGLNGVLAPLATVSEESNPVVVIATLKE